MANYGIQINDGVMTYTAPNGSTASAPAASATPGLSMIAPAYSKKAYAVGDYCIHDGKFYVCKTAIVSSSGENWTAAHWTETTVGAALAGKANKT